MKVYSQLEKAQLENTTSDTASLPKGMATYRTDVNRAKISNGTSQRELIDEDAFSPTEIATPAVPAAGRRKTYFKTDGNLYQLNSAGVERPIGTGGGGGSLQWIEADNAALAVVENFIRAYKYESGLGQAVYALVKVPASYIAGSPIKLYTEFYSDITSGNALIQSVATLIRQGVDAITSTTNQRTSTNAAVTLSGGTANIPQGLTLDLTSTTGTINSVAVAAGDLILVKLTRGTDTAAGDVTVPVFGAELTFTT